MFLFFYSGRNWFVCFYQSDYNVNTLAYCNISCTYITNHVLLLGIKRDVFWASWLNKSQTAGSNFSFSIFKIISLQLLRCLVYLWLTFGCSSIYETVQNRATIYFTLFTQDKTRQHEWLLHWVTSIMLLFLPPIAGILVTNLNHVN